MRPAAAIIGLSAVAAAGCGGGGESDAAFQASIVANMHQLLLSQVRALNQAARDIQASAPTPVGRGWDATDADAINKMKNAWSRMRAAWEATEGVIAPLFPNFDDSMDARYEDFLADLGPTGDPDLFDAQGVTGMHAVERILFAPDTPATVVAQESVWSGYLPAAWPATGAQAGEMANGLLAKLVADSQGLVDGWEPRAIVLTDAFQGMTALMNEQQNKVSLAAAHEEESRYSQRTMSDLRYNLVGTRALYNLFVPWLLARPNGAAINDGVQAAFNRLDQVYGTVFGDSIPPPPSTWNSTLPSATDQDSPFGKLFIAVVQEVDPSRTGSAVDAMNRVARTLGLPEFTGN